MSVFQMASGSISSQYLQRAMAASQASGFSGIYLATKMAKVDQI